MTVILVALARTAPIAWLAAPVAGGARSVRVLLAIALAALALPSVSAGLDGRSAWLVAARELCVGLALGVVSTVPFRAAEAAGALIDHQRRPRADGDLYARAYGWLALALFAAVDGPRTWATALLESYVAFPVGHDVAGDGAGVVIAAGASLIGLAVALASPVLVAALLADVAVALVRRSAPSLRLAAGGTTRELAALAGVALSAGTASVLLRTSFASLARDLLDGVRTLRGAGG